MLDSLDLKVRQMHEALDNLRESDLSLLKPERRYTDESFCLSIDFSQGSTEAGLANIASLLVANIACMKDHLKVWCSQNNKAFTGESLIDSDKNVALIHDLWNTDKHAKLNRPRSGHRPRIEGLSKTLCLSTGANANSSVVFVIDPLTGEMKVQTEGGGSANLQVTGRVVDENGSHLGELAEICEKATAAWEKELIRIGVIVPAR